MPVFALIFLVAIHLVVIYLIMETGTVIIAFTHILRSLPRSTKVIWRGLPISLRVVILTIYSGRSHRDTDTNADNRNMSY